MKNSLPIALLLGAGGRMLLHMPALPTSWFSTRRWLLLDRS